MDASEVATLIISLVALALSIWQLIKRPRVDVELRVLGAPSQTPWLPASPHSEELWVTNRSRWPLRVKLTVLVSTPHGVEPGTYGDIGFVQGARPGRPVSKTGDFGVLESGGTGRIGFRPTVTIELPGGVTQGPYLPVDPLPMMVEVRPRSRLLGFWKWKYAADVVWPSGPTRPPSVVPAELLTPLANKPLPPAATSEKPDVTKV